ncbi:MAG: hypothetical protein WEB00_00440 [Dehalococcoidia bacterium]
MKSARPAFYAVEGGRWADLLTLLHPPYTILHLGFVCLGAALAPEVRYDRLLATLVAFFLAVGVAAHLLDELQGRPLRTSISTVWLKAGAATSLAVACAIGIVGAVEISPLLLLFVLAGASAVVAYNLELFGGLFHGDLQFGLFWGAFPFLTANWVMTESFDVISVLGAAGCLALTMVQRSLSNPVRRLRRHGKLVEGHVTYDDGSMVALSRAELIAAPERALRYLTVAVPMLAAALLAFRALE